MVKIASQMAKQFGFHLRYSHMQKDNELYNKS
jgi:hypothetical protein